MRGGSAANDHESYVSKADGMALTASSPNMKAHDLHSFRPKSSTASQCPSHDDAERRTDKAQGDTFVAKEGPMAHCEPK